MRIVIVAPEVFPVPPIRGGAVETVIEEISAQFRDHKVTILGIADASLPVQETKEHRTYRRWKRTVIDRLLLSTWKLPFKQSNSPWYYWPYQHWIARQVQRLRPDVVWVHSRIQFAPAIRRAAPHARMIVSVHQLSTLRDERVWQQARVACCDVIAGVSQFMIEAIAARYPWTQPKTHVLSNGVDVTAYQPWWAQSARRERMRREQGWGDAPVILYAGRLVEQKGVHVLADAFKQLVRGEGRETGGAGSNTKPMLVIAGGHTYSDGTETDYIRQLKRTLEPLGSQVVWLGYQPSSALVSLYAASDVVVVPSINPEAFSMVTVEAMASGLPVVAFAHGGPAEIIRHGIDGFLVPVSRGAEGLAEALQACVSNTTLREAIGREARRTVEERFTWQRVAESFLKLTQGQGTGDRGRGNALPTPRAPRPAPQTRAVPILIAESGSGYGGSAKYLSELVSLLDRRRFHAQVVAAEEGPFIRKVKEQGVPVALRPSWRFAWGQGAGDEGRGKGQHTALSTNVKHETRNVKRTSHVRFALVAATQLLIMVPAIALWLKWRRIRLVHLNNEILSHVPLALGAKLAGCRVVCHLHGWRPFTRLERAVAGVVDEFVCISEAGARYFESQLPHRRVAAIPNGILLNGQLDGLDVKRAQVRRQLGIQPHDAVIAIIGRLVPWKGQAVFLKALADVSQRHPDVVGLIVGHDASPGQSYLTQLQSTAREHGLAERGRVHFVPWLEDVWGIYAAADIIVHASTQPEPFGLVLIEAMAAGKLVIATRSGGVVDIVTDGRTGLLVEPGDPDGLARAITQVVTDPSRAAALAEAGRQRARDVFTMERNAQAVAQVYQRLMVCR